jgi:LmbE family N-acetylglucosaminyl deacetylase
MVDLLLIVPHPDDEVFGAGGLFAKMAAHGKQVATVTLTRGSAGRTLNLCTQAELPHKRESELRAALAVLGVTTAYIWDYHDYVPDNSRGIPHHDGLQAADSGEIIARLVEVIEATEPRAVLTFAPNGANGHPDHVTTNRLTLQALAAARHAPASLYYFAAEKPYDGEARAGFLSPEAIRAQHLYPTHYVDIDAFIEAKLQAMGKHKTQALSVLMFMERFARRLRVEAFHRAQPDYPEGYGPVTVPWLQ